MLDYFQNIATVAGALVMSPLSARARLALSYIASAYAQPTVPPFDITVWSSLFPDTQRVTLGQLGEKPGNASLLEIAALSCACQLLEARQVFEIGTFDGRTTYNLALALKSDARLATLNLPAEQYRKQWIHEEHAPKSGYRFHNAPFRERIKELFCDSRVFQPGEYGGKCDMVFVDGDHSADGVESDSHLACRLIRPTGRAMIWWHDSDFANVQIGLDRFLRSKAWPRLYALEGTRLVFALLVDGQPRDLAGFFDKDCE